MSSRRLFFVSLGLLIAAQAFAQGAVSMSGQQFARTVAQGGAAEVSISRLARNRASHSQVRQFARHMVTDHTSANNELMSLAQQKGWSLPSDPDSRHQAAQRRMQRLHGSAFDRAYMQAMVSDHDKTVALFRSYARNGRDPELRQWAHKTLPTLVDHRRMAHDTANQVS